MRTNFLGFDGYLTYEERKRRLSHSVGNVDFVTCLDLSSGVKVKSFRQITLEEYSNCLSDFIAWWSVNILPDLNGFSGMSSIYFDIRELQCFRDA
jgi:hypothetical protein